ncbi:MAG: hypothetical protein J6Y28_08655 [Acholeplasmatales bacterium]|nr:hypothetical protein [Acholeplasmatales bacterium]
MKIRHLINELNLLKAKIGDDYYEKLLNFDFLVKVYKGSELIVESQNIGLYLDDITDELHVLVYENKGSENEEKNK